MNRLLAIFTGKHQPDRGALSAYLDGQLAPERAAALEAHAASCAACSEMLEGMRGVRSMPARLPALEYAPDLTVIRVGDGGRARFQKREVRIGKAFIGDRVGLRATVVDGVFEAYYGRQRIGELDMRVQEGGLPRCLLPSAPVAALPARTEAGNAEGL